MNRRKFLYLIGILASGCGWEWEEDNGDTSDPPIDPPEKRVEKTIVAEIEGQSFMSLARLERGEILAGTYCFPEETAYLYEIGKVLPVASLDVGESIFRIFEDIKDDGFIYLACEYREIFVLNPSDYMFWDYVQLKRGKQPNGSTLAGAYDVKRLLGKLVSVGGGEIYTDGYGTTREWDNEYYVKFAFQVHQTAIVAGYSYMDHCAGWFHSEDCLKWVWENIGPKYSRFMAAAVSIDPQYIYLVGTNNYQDEHRHNAATLWVYDTLIGTLTQLWNFEGFDYASCIKITDDGEVFFMLTKGWRSQESGAQLVRWDGTKPHVITEFDEAEGRELVFDGDDVYCATRLDKVRGRIYKISGDYNAERNL